MRLIDADAAVKEWYRINDIDENDRGVRFVGYTEIPRLLYHLPTIDAEPVLHCKDCKHWHNGVNITYCYKLSLAMIKENDYCSFGERRKP